MHVCHCNNLNEEKIKKVTTGDEETSDEVLEKLDKSHMCGMCSTTIEDIIEQKKAKRNKKTAPK